MTYFHSLAAFIHMGGYADYVWSAYALVGIVMLGNFIVAAVKLKQLLKRLRKQHEC